MIPLRDNRDRESFPTITWTLVVLNVLLFLWGRNWNPFGQEAVFNDLMLTPQAIVRALRGTGDRFSLVTLYTSMFMHGSLTHLVGNMIFLFVFGSGIEEALGSWRFALYYLAWGLAASMIQVYVTPMGPPSLGASGAIGGVLGAYFLLFPTNKIEIWVLLALLDFTVPAWAMLGVWFLWQVFIPQAGVANWAHAGGFLAGMLTVLIMGGPRAVLKNLTPPSDELAT